MTEAILVVVVSVLAGTLLGLMPGQRSSWLGPIRTFALTAALGVVGLHLFPEAFHALGGWALGGLAVGLFGPSWLGRLGALLWRAGRDGDRPSQLTLEASYFGLLLHHLGDGVALGAYTGELHSGHSHGDIMAAIAAHAVPVVAIMVLAFDAVQGRGSALFRAVGLALASIAGIYFAHRIPADVAETWGAWITAVVSGLLIHVVCHDLLSQLPKSRGARTLDLLVAGAGFATSLIGGSAHHEDGSEELHQALTDALAEISLETAPLLLVGLVLGAGIQAFGSRLPESWLRSRGVGWDALRGTLIGAPLPLCSCSVLPVSEALNRRRAAPALVVAFLLATPEIGVETFVLSVHFLGWPLAWVRLGAALVVAFAAALLVGWLTPRTAEASALAVAGPEPPTGDKSLGAIARRFLHGFDELFHHIGAWMVLGVIAAAFLQALLPAESLASERGTLVQLLVVSLVAIPSYICAPSATPLAAVLIAKGLSPGVVLVALLLGPVTNVVTLFFLQRWYGLRATIAATSTVVVVSWTFAFVVDGLGIAPSNALDSATHEPATPLAIGLSLLCGLLLLRSIWLSGIRSWLAALRAETGGASSGHGHGHGHGQDHGHAHAHGHGHHPGHSHGAPSDDLGQPPDSLAVSERATILSENGPRPK